MFKCFDEQLSVCCLCVFSPRAGEQLLVAGEVFLLRPLQLYAITQQLKLAKPTCANGDAKADLGHILDFTCRLKYLKVIQGISHTPEATQLV